MNSGLQANEVRADDVREPYLRWIAGAIAFERCIEGNRQRRRPTFVKRRLFHITPARVGALRIRHRADGFRKANDLAPGCGLRSVARQEVL